MSRTVVAGSAVTTPAFELLDADVREQVRRSGIDPLTEVETVRRLAQSAVRAHDDRSLSGTVRPVEDPERVVAELIARVAGFGQLIRSKVQVGPLADASLASHVTKAASSRSANAM